MLKILTICMVTFFEASHGLVRYSEEQTQFGDSPFWYEKTQSLYYVDFYGPNYSLLRFDYDTQKIYTAEILPDRMNAAFIIPIEDTLNEFAVGFPDRTVKRVYWNGISKYAHVIGKIFQVEQNSLYEENQWRLATIDPFGRFYGGTIRLKLCTFTSAANASFYRFDTVNGVQKLFGDVKMSNGVAFSLKKRKMYYAEGCKATVDSFDWDIPTGRLSNRKTIYKIFKGAGRPYYSGVGLTIDQKDNLYVGVYNGSAVIKINLDTLTDKIYHIPTPIVNGVAFGGPDLNELFVTTSRLEFNMFTAELESERITPNAGSLFIIKDVHAVGYAGTEIKLRF